MIFLLLMTCAPAFAETPASGCNQWLEQSLFGQLAQPNTQHKFNQDLLLDLQRTWRDFQISEHRLGTQSYSTLTQYLLALEERLRQLIKKTEGERDSAIQERENKFSWFLKKSPWGPAAQYQFDHIVPQKKKLKILHKALESLSEIRKAANQGLLAKDTFFFEAKTVFGRAYDQFRNEEIAIIFSKALIGREEDLLPLFALAGEIFIEFLFDHDVKRDEKVAASLTSILLSQKKTDTESRSRLSKLYKAFGYPRPISVALAAIAFAKGLNEDQIDPIKDLYDRLSAESKMDSRSISTILSYFSQKDRSPTDQEIEHLEIIYKELSQAIYDERDISTLLMVLLMSQGVEVEVAEVKELLKIVQFYREKPDLSNSSASTLAAAVYLVDDSGFVDEAYQLWRRLYAIHEVSAGAASALTFKLMLQRHQVKSSLLTNQDENLISNGVPVFTDDESGDNVPASGPAVPANQIQNPDQQGSSSPF
jgi:hypothetical protein